MISAATYLGVVGTLLFTLLSCGSYISFVLFVDFSQWIIDPDEIRVLVMRLTVSRRRRKSGERAGGGAARAIGEVPQGGGGTGGSQPASAVKPRRRCGARTRLAALGQLVGGPGARTAESAGNHEGVGGNADAERGDGKRSGARGGGVHFERSGPDELAGDALSGIRAAHCNLRLATADVAEILDRAVALVERDAPQYRVTVYKNYSPDLAPFPLDAELMERVFYNLLLNAAQASAEGGAITVKTRPCDGMAEVAVIDRGPGIEPKNREQIFNPFFTTKPEGSGLGLAIVSKIVDEHGGRIAVESEPGKGSVFRVYLPLQPKT